LRSTEEGGRVKGRSGTAQPRRRNWQQQRGGKRAIEDREKRRDSEERRGERVGGGAEMETVWPATSVIGMLVGRKILEH
jgi:hypothetical protein